MDSLKIGFIGLGNMGVGMAVSLVKAGHEVTVYNRSQDKVDALTTQGAQPARSVAEACRGDVVVTMLANDEAVEAVTFGEHGILASLAPGATHVSSSTISVALAERLTAAHADAEQGFVAAPVFGRPEAAAAAKLFVVAAGAPAAVQVISPLFEAIAQRTFVVSEEPKAANLVKLSGNFLIASVIESLGEAMALVDKAGVDKQEYLDILTSTLFGAPVYKTYGGLIARQEFEPAGFAAELGLIRTCAWCWPPATDCRCRCPSPACCVIALSPCWPTAARSWTGRRSAASPDGKPAARARCRSVSRPRHAGRPRRRPWPPSTLNTWPDLGERGFRSWVRRLRQGGKNIGADVNQHRCSRVAGNTSRKAFQKPQRPVTDREHRSGHPAAAARPQQISP